MQNDLSLLPLELNNLAKPLVLVIMDGIGIGKNDEADAVFLAKTPTLSWLKKNALYTELNAHGTYVGMPSNDDMGNSEVGHNAIGSGRIFAQGARLVNDAIKTNEIFLSKTWHWITEPCKTNNSTLHLIGLLSDGNVHSHIDHLVAIIKNADKENINKVKLHILLDGRDVESTSAHLYIEIIETLLAEINKNSNRDYAIASGGGRMNITMDRYCADWEMVKRGWEIHVNGEGRTFESALVALKTYREESFGIGDQYIPGFVVAKNAKPIGKIIDGDSVVFFNFRGDRAIEISQAFEQDSFHFFDRTNFPKIRYAGMMQYDGDLKLPSNYLVSPPKINNTISEYLVHAKINQVAIAETQKYGHVTYFWNGNKSGMFDEKYETYIEIPSDLAPFEERPWMKSAEVTDIAVKTILEKNLSEKSIFANKNEPRTSFIRINYANGDMVGHTGNILSTIMSVEAVDLALSRIVKAVKAVGGTLIVTADHGNADEMYMRNTKTGKLELDDQGKYKPKTSHTLNKVPFYIYDSLERNKYKINEEIKSPGLANIASTCLNLLGFQAPKEYEPSLIKLL